MARARSLLLLLVGGLCIAACATSPEAESNYALKRDMLAELVQRHQFGRAFPIARDLLKERPRDAVVMAYRGIIYREQMLYEEAEADLKEAIAMDGDLAMAHSALAVLYDIEERGKDAEKHHRRAVDLEPENLVYLNNLGFSYFVRGKTRMAVATFHKGLRVDPTDSRLQNNLGFAYSRLGDFARANKHFKLGGTPAQAKNNLGFAYEQQGNHAQAFNLYAEAVRLDPTMSQARKNLAHVAEIMGRELPEDLPGEGPTASNKGH